MRVQELVEKYEKNQRIDIAKEIDAQKYISIVYKEKIAELVLENCTSIVDGEVHIDSIERYILFTITVISAHTNLEFDYEDDNEGSVIDDYDMLCASGLLTKIIDTFKDDYIACQEILNMMTADRLQDNMTIEKKIYQFLDGIQYMLDSTINNFSEKINFDLLNDLDINQDELLKLRKLLENK